MRFTKGKYLKQLSAALKQKFVVDFESLKLVFSGKHNKLVVTFYDYEKNAFLDFLDGYFSNFTRKIMCLKSVEAIEYAREMSITSNNIEPKVYATYSETTRVFEIWGEKLNVNPVNEAILKIENMPLTQNVSRVKPLMRHDLERFKPTKHKISGLKW